MSGVAKGIKGVVKGATKIFKKATKAVSRVLDSDLAKVALAGAAIYFMAGAAAGSFPPPATGAGIGGTTVTEVAAATGAAATPMGSGFAGVGPGVSTAGLGSTTFAPTTVAGIAGAPPITDVSGVPAPTESILGKAGKAATGMFSWMKDNPMATMMLGQAGAGAYQAYLLDKQVEREDDIRKERGLMGFGYGGESYHKPRSGGVIASRMPEEIVKDPSSSTTAPVVERPAAPGQRFSPVPKEELPKLSRYGQLTRG